MLANPALALFIRVPSGPDPAGVRAIRLAGGGKIQLPTYRAFFLALGSIISRQSCFQSWFNRQHRPLKIPAKAARSTIYEAYSRGSPGEDRAFPARHSWRISLLPAFGSLHARSGSAPAAGRSFLPSPLLGKFQLEIHILFACIIQHHHGIIGFAGFLTEKSGHGNAALL